MSRKPESIAIDLLPVLPGGENGGAKVFVLELIRHLAALYPSCRFTLLVREEARQELSALVSHNVELTPIVSDTEDPKFLDHLGAKSKQLLYRRIWGRLNRLAASWIEPVAEPPYQNASFLRKLGVELLFCPFTDPTYYEPGIPVVCTIHDLQYITYPQFFTEEDVRHRDAVFMRAADRATLLAAVSEYARASAIQHGSIQENRIRTIYHRLAHRVLNKPDHSVLGRLQLVAKQYLIYPANFWRHKNHEILISAFSLAVRQGLHKGMKLVLTGAPGERQRWLKEAGESMGLGDRVVFPGYVSNAELGALIGNSQGVVFPSLYEGFGIPVIEAMGAGVPVACSNLTSLPEVAGGAALLFDPRLPQDIATAMIKLTTDESLRSQLMKSGAERAQLFSDGQLMAREHMALFEDALKIESPGYQVAGRFEDGWMGPRLWIQTEFSESPKTLVFVFSTEGWIPGRSVKLRLNVDGKPFEKFRMKKGITQTIEITLQTGNQLLEWAFTPTHIPRAFGLGDDPRLLSLVLKECFVISENGSKRDLLVQRPH